MVETKHFADLFVWISKRGIATLGGFTTSQTECSCGSAGQRGCGHRKRYNRYEPKLRRSQHDFSHLGVRTPLNSMRVFALGSNVFFDLPITTGAQKAALTT
ncbi:MAG TPA: hypothetical protein VMF32_01110 [Xanthobacteraceae bacterium]|nr:hypothetical protein [Xanthobacteraceae bacterium]